MDPDRVPLARRLMLPVGAWFSTAVAVLSVQYLARRTQASASPNVLDGWVQFDGPEYLSIAANGYEQPQLVWFPSYPLLVRVVDVVLGSPVLSAVLVSALAGLVAAVLFWIWTEDRDIDSAARRVVLAMLLLYPYGWFLYGVVYADALFLLFVLAAFLLVERDHPILAAVAGAGATATRPAGFAVAMGIWVLWLERQGVLRVPGPSSGWVHQLRLPLRVDRSAWTVRSFLPLLSLSGLGGYMLYQWARWGSPIRFVGEQANYHDTGRGTFLKQQYFEAWYGGFDARHLATTTAQAVILMVVLASVPAIGRRFGWGYGVYVFGLAVFPMLTVSTFMGSGRYLLPCFPFFALAGEWLSERRPLMVAWFAVASCALVVMVFGFSRSWYLT